MSRHSPDTRKRAYRLFQEGMSTADIAQIVGVPRQTVTGWVYSMSKEDAEPPKIGRPRGPMSANHDAAHIIERVQEENARYSRFYNDPNVALLGDPPLHRSALGQKLRAEGKL